MNIRSSAGGPEGRRPIRATAAADAIRTRGMGPHLHVLASSRADTVDFACIGRTLTSEGLPRIPALACPAEKEPVVRNNGFDPGLLEHDFRQPDAIETARRIFWEIPPWKIAVRGIVPAKERAPECFNGNQRRYTCTNSATTRN